jgi:hypothetical protein
MPAQTWIRPKAAAEAFLARHKEGAGVIRRFAGKVARRAIPGVATGAQVGQALGPGGARQGAVAGGVVSVVAPRLVSRIALPVAAAAGAVDIGRAGVEAYKGARAQAHVKKQAAGAKKAGATVTRAHPVVGMIAGRANIKVSQTEAGRKAGEAHFRKERAKRKRTGFERRAKR